MVADRLCELVASDGDTVSETLSEGDTVGVTAESVGITVVTVPDGDTILSVTVTVVVTLSDGVAVESVGCTVAVVV